MDRKHYGMEASLCYVMSTKSKERMVVQRHFPRAADAIRFAIESLGPKIVDGCSLEAADGHYFGREIRHLYDDRAYPLRRQASSTLGEPSLGSKQRIQ